ncbi:hypothetical protein D3C80_741080 [compost metagenome]
MRKAEFFAQHEGFGNGDHGNAEDHVVADLGSLAVAALAAMHDLLAHRLQHRLRRREGLRFAAAHEGQGAGSSATRAPGDRRVNRGATGGSGQFMRLQRAFHIHRRAIDEQRAGRDLFNQIAIGGNHMFALRQHGDDHLSRFDGFGGIRGNGNARLFRRRAAGVGKIVTPDGITRLDEIGGHRQAHMSQPEKSDGLHRCAPFSDYPQGSCRRPFRQS